LSQATDQEVSIKTSCKCAQSMPAQRDQLLLCGNACAAGSAAHVAMPARSDQLLLD